jgi:hypothetical protein
LESGGRISAAPHLLQESLSFLEVGNVKTFGEPAIDRCQQFRGLDPLALLLPQTTQAHRRPQLQRLRLLAPGHLEGLLQAGFSLRRRPRQRTALPLGLPLQKLALQAVELCLVETDLMLMHGG